MTHLFLTPINHPNPFNPPLVCPPLHYKAVWISKLPLFTVINGAALRHPESWVAPTYGLFPELVDEAINVVLYGHAKEPKITIYCTKDAAELINVNRSIVDVLDCLPPSDDLMDEAVISARLFHTRTIIIRYKRSIP